MKPHRSFHGFAVSPQTQWRRFFRPFLLLLALPLAVVGQTSPTVQFTACPTNGTVPLTVQFTCPGIDSQTNAITEWNWNFGDGVGTSASQNPSYTYTNAGIFSPVLIATNGNGLEVPGSAPSIQVYTSQTQFHCTTNAGAITVTGYTGSGGSVFIPPTINSLPVTSIGYQAFAGLNLTSVTIPASVTNIGEAAFADCRLTNATICNGVTGIGADAFENCLNLRSVTIPGNITNFGNVFLGCTNLTSVTIANGATGIVQDAFYDCGTMTSITIPGSVTSIGSYAFQSCSNLTIATIPNGVTSIGADAFAFCSNLTNITIPASVTSIGNYAFAACSSLTAITVDSNNLFYSSVNGVLFDITQSTLLVYPPSLGGSYTIPDSVTTIGSTAFAGCASLSSVTIPGSVTTIRTGAFQSCTSLGSVTIPASVTSIGSEAFAFCTKLTWVCFLGNAPTADASVFLIDTNATRYYLPGTTGWGSPFAGPPAVLWNPLIQAGGANFGVQSNQFGFTITNGSTHNIPIVVEACTTLASPVWTPLTNVILTNSIIFSDPQWSNYPALFYGLGLP